MRRSRVVDEYGCELTAEEQKEVDERAQEITENFFGAKKSEDLKKAAADKVNDMAAGVRKKKRPGRPKRNPQEPSEKSQNEVTVHEDPQREVPVIPEEVVKTIEEKIATIERTVKNYDEQIEELKSDCQRNVELFEGYKKEAEERLQILGDFLRGAKNGQS